MDLAAAFCLEVIFEQGLTLSLGGLLRLFVVAVAATAAAVAAVAAAAAVAC